MSDAGKSKRPDMHLSRSGGVPEGKKKEEPREPRPIGDVVSGEGGADGSTPEEPASPQKRQRGPAEAGPLLKDAADVAKMGAKYGTQAAASGVAGAAGAAGSASSTAAGSAGSATPGTAGAAGSAASGSARGAGSAARPPAPTGGKPPTPTSGAHSTGRAGDPRLDRYRNRLPDEAKNILDTNLDTPEGRARQALERAGADKDDGEREDGQHRRQTGAPGKKGDGQRQGDSRTGAGSKSPEDKAPSGKPGGEASGARLPKTPRPQAPPKPKVGDATVSGQSGLGAGGTQATPGAAPKPPVGPPKDKAGSGKSGAASSAAAKPVDSVLGRSSERARAAQERNAVKRSEDDRGATEKRMDAIEAETGIDVAKTAGVAAGVGLGLASAGVGAAVAPPLVEGGIKASTKIERHRVRATRNTLHALAAAVLVGLLALVTMSTSATTAPPPTIEYDDSSGSCIDGGGGFGQVDSGSMDFSETQMGYAATIVQTGVDMGIPHYGLVVAIATVLQESTLLMYANSTVPESLNYPHDKVGSDHDSVGLFQQRPKYWGSVQELMDPVISSQKFYDALNNVSGWESMSVAKAAQAVQISAYPDEYAKHEANARAIVGAVLDGAGELDGGFGGTVICGDGEIPQCVGAEVSPPSALDGLTPDATLVATCGTAYFSEYVSAVHGVGERPNKSDHGSGRAVDFMIIDWNKPEGKANGDKVAETFTSNHLQFGVKYVIWYDEIWFPDSGWEPYTHPNVKAGTAKNTPTLRHQDHVHVSVFGNKAKGSAGGATGEWTHPLPSGVRTSPYGWRTGRFAGWHNGQDWGASCGTPLRAAAGGTVIAVGGPQPYDRETNPGGNTGNQLVIDHGNGIWTRYGHYLSGTEKVALGQSVVAGQEIAGVGGDPNQDPNGSVGAGTSSGCHLHFVVHTSGDTTDPVPFLRNKGVKIT